MSEHATPQTEIAQELAKYLESAGARLEIQDSFEEQYGLDFCIIRLKDVHAHVNLGVHITSELNDLEYMEALALASRRGIVLKALYIEVQQEIMDAGALLAAFSACLSVLFDQRHAHSKLLGLRVHEDCSFQFFDLEESIERLQRVTSIDEMDIGQDLIGRIIAYFTEKGFGFIQTDDEIKYFFHIANIVDDELRVQLPNYMPGEIIPVEFQYGGHDGKKYPKAINVTSIID